MLRNIMERMRRALRNARFGIWTIALAYALGVGAGMTMVHAGNRYAIDYRDRLVGQAVRESPILRQLQKGGALTAASLDAAGNAAAGATSLLAGYCVPAGYGVAVHRGWIGGVVSVDGEHRSRLAKPYGAFYYLMTLLLQLIPYSLAGGAGINLGLATFAGAARTRYPGARVRWLRIPYEALRDAVWIYALAVPLFAIASLFEFLM